MVIVHAHEPMSFFLHIKENIPTIPPKSVQNKQNFPFIDIPPVYSSFTILTTEKMSEYDRKSETKEFDDTKTGVKGLLEKGLSKIPRIFFHDQYILEKKSISARPEYSVPIIDFEGLNEDAVKRKEIFNKVKDACESWGFFQIINHGIQVSILDKVTEGIRKFHELETEVKKQYYSRDVKRKITFNTNFDLLQASTANWRDSIYFVMAPDPPEPEEIPEVCRYVPI